MKFISKLKTYTLCIYFNFDNPTERFYLLSKLLMNETNSRSKKEKKIWMKARS